MLSKTTINANDTIQLTVPVSNTGKRIGTEVVQGYIRKVNEIDGPIKTLRGYKRVKISADKTLQIAIDLNPSSFEFFDWSQRKMMVNPGEYEVYYGNSSDSKHLKTTKITIQ